MQEEKEIPSSAQTNTNGAQEQEQQQQHHHHHHHHHDGSVNDSYFGALSEGRTRAQHKEDIKNQFHRHSKKESKKNQEYFNAVAKKSPKDHLHLFALDGMRASLPFIRAFVAALVILRLMLITMSVIFGRYYVSRQVEYTVAWVLILTFALIYQPNIDKIDNFKVYTNKMRIISLLAAIACAMKALITLIYNWDMFAIQAWMTAYSILEITAWIALAVFFSMFWRYWNRQRSKIHRAIENEL